MYGSVCAGSGAVNERPTITPLIWSFAGFPCISVVFVSQEVKPAFHMGFDTRGILGRFSGLQHWLVGAAVRLARPYSGVRSIVLFACGRS